MSNYKLLAAKEFIEGKQYEIARSVLEALPEDATARKWLSKLNEMYPKPKTVEAMSNDELLGIISSEDALKELKKRIKQMESAATGEWYNQEKRKNLRQELSDFINHIIMGLPKIADTPSIYYFDDLLVYALQVVSETYLSSRGESELDNLAKLLKHEDFEVRDHARIILWKIESLTAKLIRLPMAEFSTGEHYSVTWTVPDINSLSDSPVPILDVYESGTNIFTVTMSKYKVHFPSWDWTTEHFAIASLVFEAAYNIWEGSLPSFDDPDEEIDILRDVFDGDEDAYEAWDEN